MNFRNSLEIIFGIIICLVALTLININTIAANISWIVNDFAVLVFFTVYTILIKRKTYWIGLASNALIIGYIGITENRDWIFYFHILIFLSCYLSGYFWHKRRRKAAVLVVGLISIIILGLGSFIYTKVDFEPTKNVSIENLRKFSDHLVGHDGKHPTFSRDTVYLVNFSFHRCLPCRVKKKYTPEIVKRFKNHPFRLIEIHSFEDKKVFDESYMLDYTFVYHDSLDKLAKLYKISGGPEELIFNKKGLAVRKFSSFNKDVAETYVTETESFILKLLKE